MEANVFHCTGYIINEVKDADIRKLAEFVVAENQRHHCAADEPFVSEEDSINSVCNEEMALQKMKSHYLTNLLCCVIAMLAGISCGTTTRNEVFIDTFALQEAEQVIKIPIDENTRTYTFSMHHFEDNDATEYVTLENPDYDSKYGVIQYYRLDSCKLSHTVKINYEGDNTIAPPLFGHGTLNLDEIMLTCDIQYFIYKINKNGKIIHRYQYCTNEEQADQYIGVELMSMYYNPLVVKNGKIYAALYLPASEYWSTDGHEIQFDKYPLNVEIDTATGDLKYSELRFPKLRTKFDKIGYLNNYSRIYDGKAFVYSFCALDSLYVTTDMRRFSTYPAKSRYMEINDEGYKMGLPHDESTKLVNTQARYGNIIHDKYRNVYYRFCHMRDDKVRDGDFTKYMRTNYLICHGEFSVQIIDSTFHVVGETKFERGKYAPMLFFVNKEGLWLSENNDENPNVSDDWLIFRCLKLIKNENI